MAKLKTRPEENDPVEYLNAIEDDTKRKDCLRLMEIMEQCSGEKAKMWGKDIVGFGTYRYKYASGREGDWMLTGFSPRKQNISVYLMCGVDNIDEILKGLGKYKNGKSCLYIKKMADINEEKLREAIVQSIEITKKQYG